MKTIKIELELNPADAGEMQAFNTFLEFYKSAKVDPTNTVTTLAPEKKAKPTPEKKKDESSEVTEKELRELLGEKVKEHKEAIKAKLTELGAPNISKLPMEKYADLYELLKSL